MTRKNYYYGALVIGAAATLTLAVTLTFSLSRSHRQPTPAASAPALAQATTSVASEPKGAQKEGIKVHGHWTIEVRNPDGTLVTHREFENSLAPDGPIFLSRVLSRRSVGGELGIELDTSPLDQSICASEQNGILYPSSCLIREPSNTDPVRPYLFKNLTVSLDSDHNTVVLSANITAQRSGKVTSVSTNANWCSPGGPPACTANAVFTIAGLPTPVTAVAGQIVQVTVVISFS